MNSVPGIFFAVVMLMWTPWLPAEEPATGSTGVTAQAPSQVDMQDEESADDEGGWSGLTIALLIFFIAFAYIFSSATALNRLGGKGRTAPPKPRERPRSSNATKGLPEGRDRFRL